MNAYYRGIFFAVCFAINNARDRRAGKWYWFLQRMSCNLVQTFSCTSFCYPLRTRSILLPVLVPALSFDWSLLLLLFCSSKTSSSDRVNFGRFSSAMFICGSGNFAAGKLVPEIDTSFWYRVPARLSGA